MIDRRKIPFITITVFLLNVLGMIYEFKVGENVAASEFAMYKGALQEGEWWRVVMSSFVHYGLAHFASNMICLVLFGISFEKSIGSFKYALIYLASILGAGILINYHGGQALHAGASGGIWGLMGATLMYTLKNHKNPLFVGRAIVVNLIYSFSEGVSWQGHIGGGIAGFLMASVLIVIDGKNRSST